MPRTYRLCVLYRKPDQLFVGALIANQTVLGGLAESEPELDAGNGVDERFVYVLARLDEVRHAYDYVCLFRLLDGYEFKFHYSSGLR
ncbi:hypothetical protein ES703_63774 [subsurface metagenome]